MFVRSVNRCGCCERGKLQSKRQSTDSVMESVTGRGVVVLKRLLLLLIRSGWCNVCPL